MHKKCVGGGVTARHEAHTIGWHTKRQVCWALMKSLPAETKEIKQIICSLAVLGCAIRRCSARSVALKTSHIRPFSLRCRSMTSSVGRQTWAMTSNVRRSQCHFNVWINQLARCRIILTYRPIVLRLSFFGNQSFLSSNHCQYCRCLHPHNTDDIAVTQNSCFRRWPCCFHHRWYHRCHRRR